MPRVFAAVALVVGIVGGIAHLACWLSLQEISDWLTPYRDRTAAMPGVHSAWKFYEALIGAMTIALLAKMVAAGLLVTVSWGLWYRRWWARRVVLAWSLLMLFTFVLDFALLGQVTAAIADAEAGALRELLGSISHHVATIPAGMASTLTDWAVSMASARVFSDGDAQFAGVLNAGLLYYYCAPMIWFPALCAFLFGRPSAHRYFEPRPRRDR